MTTLTEDPPATPAVSTDTGNHEPEATDSLLAETLSNFSDFSDADTEATDTTNTTTTATEPEAEAETDPEALADAPETEAATTEPEEEDGTEVEAEDEAEDAAAETEESENEEDSETEEEEEDDEDEDDPESDLSAGAQKRIDKLTAQKSRYKDERDTAREEIESLKAEVEESQRTAVTLAPTAANPLANISTDEALADRRAQAQRVYDWAIHPDNRDGVTVGDVDYTADEVADKRRDAEMELQLHIPKRQDWIAANRQHSQQARQLYPFLFEKGTAAGNKANDILSKAPGLMELPDYELIVGDSLMGLAVRQGHYKMVPVKKQSDNAGSKKPGTGKAKAKAKTPAAAAAAAKPAPKPPAAASKAAPAARPAPSKTTAASRRLYDSGGADSGALADLADSLLDG